MDLKLLPTATTATESFQKCGEITTAVRGNKMFALNCIFCTEMYLQLEQFVLHIEEAHREQLLERLELAAKYEDEIKEFLPEPSLLEEQYQEEPNDEEAQTVEVKFADMIKERRVSAFGFKDPLEEAPTEVQFPNSCDVKEESNVATTSETHASESDDGDDMNDDIGENNNSEYEDKSDSSESESNTETDTEDHNDSADNKDLTLAIISGYEKHRILWDDNEPMSKNRKKRDEAFKKIANSINKQLGMHLKSQTIGSRIKKLRYKFRSELQNLKLAETKGDKYTPLWYYSKLTFLNTSIKYKQRNKRGAKALANEKPALPLSNLTDAQNLELIEIYKSFACLWDVQHIGFRFKNQRQDALDEMLQAIKNKMNLNFSQDELQKKLYRIRYACTQEKHRKLQCDRAQEEFKPSCKYYEHINFLADNVGPFKCPFCEETFNGADQYKIHKSKHDGSMPFTCPLCNRGFMKVGNCTVHLRRHTRDFDFECKECGKRYATSTDVNVHMRYHTGEKPYFCEVCGQSFRTWTFFDAHMRRHKKHPNHKCTICSKAFYENNKLTEHMKAHLNVRDKVCNVCGKAFTSSKYLRQHKQIHAEKKKYVCKICSKDFAQYAGLSGHMKSHGTTVSGAIADEHH